jgi:aspartate aminotransferase-like enzyme
MTNSFIPPRRTLMGPGPSDVSHRVLAAMARPTIGHLDPQFVRMMDEIKAMLPSSIPKSVRDSARWRVRYGALA